MIVGLTSRYVVGPTAAIAVALLLNTTGAFEGDAVPAKGANAPPNRDEVAKMQMGRVIRVAKSRIELVAVDTESTGGDAIAGPSDDRLKIADGAFDELVFGQNLDADAAREQAGQIVREKLDAIEIICA